MIKWTKEGTILIIPLVGGGGGGGGGFYSNASF